MKSSIKDIKSFSSEQLVAKVAENKDVLAKLKFAHSVSPIENPMRMKFLRKDIARLITEINARN